eukprot:Skav215419  [mRNA]  locus=scaffold356:567422:591347:- [translate_table: standard]
MRRMEWEAYLANPHILDDVDPLILDLLSSRSLITVMWLTPLFYAVLTFRTLRQLFQQDVSEKQRPGPGADEGETQRRNNSATLDAALLQDMVWHTVIDMIDIVNMMFMDSAEQSEGASTQFLNITHPKEAQQIRIAAGTFIILGLFFHQQSYPSFNALEATLVRSQSHLMSLRLGSARPSSASFWWICPSSQ